MKAAALLLALTLAACADPIRGTVVDCHDGDTIKVRLADRTFLKVRLQSIDAPEIKQLGGIESRDTLRRLAPLNQPVFVESTQRDKYGRALGTLFRNGQNLNLTLVRSGQAWVYRKYCSDPVYLHAEAQAQKEHLGIWKNPSAMAPWIFRHLPKRPVDKLVSVQTGR
ncbi:MAG: thermonuclease family protein [Hyphomicrobiaceae bacterium]|nr:MAG: thermonuclease family protein [Hyphomicrobiaceae bacterium]